jgi:hypothetical protein
MSGMQTGGKDRHWLFDPTTVEHIGPIASKLAHWDEYFTDEPNYETVLALVMDQLLASLPAEQEEAVRLVHLAGVTQRAAGRTIGVDHKTVKARADKGLAALRDQIENSVWIADLLRGMIPPGLETPLVGKNINTILGALKVGNEKE